MAWEDVAEEKLYKQLGMTSTSSRGELRYWCVSASCQKIWAQPTREFGLACPE
jgi:hypothetical protein